MIHHHPQLVRMYVPDGTLHCSVHGRLDEAEAADVLSRTGLSATAVRETRFPRGLRRLAWLMDQVARFRPARCEWDQ